MTQVIAHRGASARAPENTVAAFELARQLGADGVELDVRRTRDGRAAVHHDAALTSGRLLCDLASDDLPDSVPLLHEVLAVCGAMTINVEIKNLPSEPGYDPDQRIVSEVVEVVRSTDVASQILVSSFSFAAIDRVRSLASSVATAWLVLLSPDPVPLIERAAAGGHRGIHPSWSMVDEAFVDRAHRAGLVVNTWTVDDPDQIRRLADIGVDGVITNVPDVALAALGRGPAPSR